MKKPKMGIAIALMKKAKDKPQEEEEQESPAFGDAAREAYEALKAEDYEGFKGALRSAIEIVSNEG